MIRFFRNIRKQLAADNKPAKYMRYAIGEVVLIMLGIFMALQLQNWNIERKQEVQFKQSLEQLYNTVNDDISHYGDTKRVSRDAMEYIDFLLTDTVPEVNHAGGFWFLFNYFRSSQFGGEAVKTIDNIQFNPNDEDQSNLVRQLNSYREVIHRVQNYHRSNDVYGREYLFKKFIPQPGYNIDSVHFGMIADSTFYSFEELNAAIDVLKDPYFRTLLKSQKSVLSFIHLDSRMLEEDSEAIMNLIERFHPDVKLLYQDVGIIGTSIDGFNDVGAKSTPMTLMNEEENIWEITIYLKVGRVKFRCRDSWAINWGGIDFPKGEGLSNGPDIHVPEAGNYRVVLNLTTKTYEFIKLELTN